MRVNDKTRAWATGFLNVLLWLAFVFYIWGGTITSSGRPKFTFVGDIVLIVAVVYSLLRLPGLAHFRATYFGRSFERLFEGVTGVKSWVGLQAGSWVQLVGGVYLLALFILMPILHFYSFQNSAFDLGIIHNTVWNASQGNGFITHFLIRETGPTQYFPSNRLNFGLFLFAGLYKITPSVIWLLVGQSLALLLALVPLYQLAKRILPPSIPVWMPLVAYWCFDPIHRMNFWDWHETPFLIPLGLWALLAIERGQIVRSLVLMLAMAAWREDAWWTACGMSLYAAARTGAYAVYIPAALASFAVFPYHAFTINSVNTLGERYPYLGPSLTSGLHTLSTKPWVLLEVAAENWLFWLKLVLFAGGPFFLWSGFGILTLLAPLLINGLSQWDGMLNWVNHYVGTFTAPLFFCTMLGWRTWFPWLEARLGKDRALSVVGLSLALCVSRLAVSEPGAFTKWRGSLDRQRCLTELVSIVPPDAAVLATDPVAARLSGRAWISLPFRWIHLSEDEWSRIDQSQAKWLVSGAIKHRADASWKVIKEGCGLYVASRE